jgi:hypothetical protein
LAHQLGTEVQVTPLSTRPELAGLLEEWIKNQIAPRAANAQRLSRESIQRKTRSLAQRVFHALEISAKASTIPPAEGSDKELAKAEAQLRTAASLIEGTRTKCFEQTDVIRDAAHAAIRWLAERAIVLWEKESKSSQLEDTWVARNVNQLAQAEAERLAQLIQSAAEKMTRALDEAARVLSTGEREDRLNLHSFVKEMPVAEFAPNTGPLRRPLAFSVSAAWARRSVEHELERHLGAMLIEFFNSYGRAVEVWARTTLDNLAREFETHADVYRAQLQRLTSPTSPQESNATESILQDMAFLKEKLELEEINQPVESSAGT